MNGRIILGTCLLALAIAAALHAQERRVEGKTIVEWSALLSSKDVGERRVAAETLDRAGPKAFKAIKALVKAAGDDDLVVRLYSIRALGKIGTSAREGVPAVVKALKEGHPTMSRLAAVTLSRMGKDAIAPLSEVLGGDDPSARRWAAASLGLMGPAAANAAPALLKALKDDSFRVRRTAIDALNRVQPTAEVALAPLAAVLREDTDPDVCRGAASALGRLGKAAEPELRKLLASRDDNVRYHAALATRELGPRAAPMARTLALLLLHREDDLRGAASVALEGIGEAALPALKSALADKDADVRRAGALGLGVVGKPAAASAPLLLTAAGDDDPEVALAAVQALGQVGDVPGLRSILKGKDARLRKAAIEGLGSLKSEAAAAVDDLHTAMRGKAPAERQAATIALFSIGKPAVPGLIKSLAEKDTQLRILTLIALAQIGEDSKPAVPHMARALEDDNDDVRIYAARCLGRLGGVAKSALPALKKAAKSDDPVLRKEAAEAVRLVSD
jgi:HEAT repeat protein